RGPGPGAPAGGREERQGEKRSRAHGSFVAREARPSQGAGPGAPQFLLISVRRSGETVPVLGRELSSGAMPRAVHFPSRVKDKEVSMKAIVTGIVSIGFVSAVLPGAGPGAAAADPLSRAAVNQRRRERRRGEGHRRRALDPRVPLPGGAGAPPSELRAGAFHLAERGRE